MTVVVVMVVVVADFHIAVEVRMIGVGVILIAEEVLVEARNLSESCRCFWC